MRGMRQGRTAGRKWGILILIVMLAVLLAVPPAGIVHAAKKPKKSRPKPPDAPAIADASCFVNQDAQPFRRKVTVRVRLKQKEASDHVVLRVRNRTNGRDRTLKFRYRSDGTYTVRANGRSRMEIRAMAVTGKRESRWSRGLRFRTKPIFRDVESRSLSMGSGETRRLHFGSGYISPNGLKTTGTGCQVTWDAGHRSFLVRGVAHGDAKIIVQYRHSGKTHRCYVIHVEIK
ncbi:hypothetical protein ACTNEM_07315 [Eubacterium pyruvativorans]|uniref:hypothetical protein n=1 Tax=Eubacterium pyruvativorans TaxID=155865 RepID=UPI003F8CCBAC